MNECPDCKYSVDVNGIYSYCNNPHDPSETCPKFCKSRGIQVVFESNKVENKETKEEEEKEKENDTVTGQ